jgi:hypothetical protein
LAGPNEWQQVCNRSNPENTGRSCEGADFSWLSSKVSRTLLCLCLCFAFAFGFLGLCFPFLWDARRRRNQIIRYSSGPTDGTGPAIHHRGPGHLLWRPAPGTRPVAPGVALRSGHGLGGVTSQRVSKPTRRNLAGAHRKVEGAAMAV